MMNNPGIDIQVSESTVKIMAMGAVALGVVWLVWQMTDDKPEEHLPSEAEDYTHLKAVKPSRLDEIQYDVGIVPQVKDLYENGHHEDAVFKACKLLFEVIRTVSGYEEKDGTKLIDIVFKEKKILLFQDTTKAHVKGVEDGFIEGMRFLAKSVRNLNGHDNVVMTETDAITYINMACFLAFNVQHNTVKAIDTVPEAAE